MKHKKEEPQQSKYIPSQDLISRLQESEEKFKELFNQAADGILVGVGNGEIINAVQAYELGIVNRIMNVENFIEEVLTHVSVLQKNSLRAVLAAKQSIRKSRSSGWEDFLINEKHLCSDCFNHPDRVEGMDAFSDKRSPKFNA